MTRYVDYRVALLAAFLGVLATAGLGLSVAVGLIVFAGTPRNAASNATR